MILILAYLICAFVAWDFYWITIIPEIGVVPRAFSVIAFLIVLLVEWVTQVEIYEWYRYRKYRKENGYD